MPWPDIFFRAGKRRQEKLPPLKLSTDGGPRLNSPALPTVVINSKASSKKEGQETGETSPPQAEAQPSIAPDKAAITVSPPAFTVPVPVGTVTNGDSPQTANVSTSALNPSEKTVASEISKPADASPKVETVPSETVVNPVTPESSIRKQEPEKKSEVGAQGKSIDAPSLPSSGNAEPDKSTAVSTAPVEATLSKSSEKKEFLLVNGERILGNVLSETPENIYLNHGTLGVLTLPRSQIATRPVEIILINGDRIVGDIMAETPDTLYVRHASLGMLTVPRSQRSTRVVEALLTDGDRIVGEVLTETGDCTVIRSSTLGLVTVPHNKVAMLNRKVEQIELKSLPSAPPAIKDKPVA